MQFYARPLRIQVEPNNWLPIGYKLGIGSRGSEVTAANMKKEEEGKLDSNQEKLNNSSFFVRLGSSKVLMSN